jgi:hypothetical protein
MTVSHAVITIAAVTIRDAVPPPDVDEPAPSSSSLATVQLA